MPDKKFELGDYVEVRDRIKLFYELFAGGRLVTKNVKILTAPDGTQRVLVKALAYRTVDDPLPGVGTSWLAIPGSTPYTRGSEVENAETSAWGRAIGALGILIDKSIATSNEIQNKEGQPIPGIVGTREHPAPLRNGDGGLIGKVEIAKDSPDFLPHVGPDGAVLSFKLVSPKGGIKVIAKGTLAEVIALAKDQTLGAQVTCWGKISDEPFTPKGTKKVITYQVLALERIKTPTYTAPASTAPASDDVLEEPPDDVELFAEAESEPLGLVS